MKLSEAIRLGSMLHPQHFDSMFDYEAGAIVATCALGAAVQAGYRVCDMRQFARCPVCGESSQMDYMVIHMNDGHHWTREAIADWVEVIEKSIEPTPQPQLVNAA